MRTRTVCMIALAALAGCAGNKETESPAVVGSPEHPVRVDEDLLAQIEQTAADLRALNEDPDRFAAEDDAFEPSATPTSPLRANTAPAIEIEQPTPAPVETTLATGDDQSNAELAAPEHASVSEAARALAAALRRGEADPVRVYAALAALDMVAPGVMVNPSAIEGLTPEDARVLESWADLMRSASDGLDSAPGDAGALARAVLDAAAEAESLDPLEISTAKLCSRVEGFGRYSPMSSTWLAGGQHRTIVYAEVDHFASRLVRTPSGAEQYEVRLTQELQLYHDVDGLLAWRMPPQDVRDVSRNRRRDFFVVQMVDLPASLSVGRYQLKITLRDEATRQTCETVLPILIVADEELIGPTPIR